MKRQLDKTERQISIKQLKRKEIELKKLEQNIEFNEDLIKTNKVRRDNDEKWASYRRNQTEEADDQSLKLIRVKLEDIQEHIDQLSSQIKYGVEIKEKEVKNGNNN